VTTALTALIISLGVAVFGLVAQPMIKAEQEHRQHRRVRAAWQCQVLDPYPVRTRRRRLTAVLTLIAIVVVMVAAVVLVAMFG
jgi:hypothetical protein